MSINDNPYLHYGDFNIDTAKYLKFIKVWKCYSDLLDA